MTCRELAELLLEYLGGELGADQCQHVESHLQKCRVCVTYIETYRITIQLGRRLPKEDPLPQSLMQRLQQALQSMEEEGK